MFQKLFRDYLDIKKRIIWTVKGLFGRFYGQFKGLFVRFYGQFNGQFEAVVWAVFVRILYVTFGLES